MIKTKKETQKSILRLFSSFHQKTVCFGAILRGNQNINSFLVTSNKLLLNSRADVKFSIRAAKAERPSDFLFW